MITDFTVTRYFEMHYTGHCQSKYAMLLWRCTLNTEQMYILSHLIIGPKNHNFLSNEHLL